MQQTAPDAKKDLGDLLKLQNGDDSTIKLDKLSVTDLLDKIESGKETKSEEVKLAIVTVNTMIKAKIVTPPLIISGHRAHANQGDITVLPASEEQIQSAKKENQIERSAISGVKWLERVKQHLEVAEGKPIVKEPAAQQKIGITGGHDIPITPPLNLPRAGGVPAANIANP